LKPWGYKKARQGRRPKGFFGFDNGISFGKGDCKEPIHLEASGI